MLRDYIQEIIINESLLWSAKLTITVCIKTELGNIIAELYPKKAPITVAKFLDNISIGLYENSYFFRSASSDEVLNNFAIDIIQAGKADSKTEACPITHESSQVSGLLNKTGILSMSRDEPGTAASSFFINVADNPVLDFQEETGSLAKREGYATFGKIIQGMDIVGAIHQGEKGSRELTDLDLSFMEEMRKNNKEEAHWMLAQYLNRNITIYSIDVVTENVDAIAIEKT